MRNSTCELTGSKREPCPSGQPQSVRVTTGGFSTELGAPEVPRLVQERLLARGENGKYIADATWLFIEASADARWLPEAFAFLKRLSTRRNCRNRYLVPNIAEYLCRFGHRVEDVLRLASRHTASLGEVARLAIERAPHIAPNLVRQALRHSVEKGKCRNPFAVDGVSQVAVDMALTLAAIDRPWARRELYQVLDETQKEGLSIEKALPCVVALAESTDREARKTAAAWRDLLNADDYELMERDFFHKVPVRRRELEEVLSKPMEM